MREVEHGLFFGGGGVGAGVVRSGHVDDEAAGRGRHGGLGGRRRFGEEEGVLGREVVGDAVEPLALAVMVPVLGCLGRGWAWTFLWVVLMLRRAMVLLLLMVIVMV